MYIWFALWAIAATAEAILYSLITHPISRLRWFRIFFGLSVAVAVMAAGITLVSRIGAYWLFPILLTPYRLVNIARYMRYRLEPHRLRSVSLRAFGWLVATQVVFGLLAWAVRTLEMTQILAVLASGQLLVALVLLRSSTLTWEHARPKPLEKHYTDKELPSVSVLIPARDETEALQECLTSLIANDYPKLEIIVLDDCSLDRRTPEIIRGFAHDGVRFIKGQVPPDDWVAKNYAYEQLRQEASGDVLLFCGVDTTFEPRTVRALVETMLVRDMEMISVLPTRPKTPEPTLSYLQTMRYYWELCLPRRMFKRPPVLSTCWLIRTQTLESFGRLASVSQSVSPEAHFARKAVVSNKYNFIRSDGDLQVHSRKTMPEQFDTTVRLRYPQLHRRIELVAAATLFEGVFFIGPFLGVALCWLLPHPSAYFALWAASVLVVEVMYYLIAVQTKLNSPLVAFLTAPFGFAADIVMLYVSMLRYEFGTVSWKGRNVCIPVMRVEPKLPKV